MHKDQSLPLPDCGLPADDITAAEPRLGLHIILVVLGFVHINYVPVWCQLSDSTNPTQKSAPCCHHLGFLGNHLAAVDCPEFESQLKEVLLDG